MKKISHVNETYYYNLISHYNTLLLLFSFSIKYIIIYLIAVLNIAVWFIFILLSIFLFLLIMLYQILLFIIKFLLFSFFLLTLKNANNFCICLTIWSLSVWIKRNLCTWLEFLFILLLFYKILMFYMNLIYFNIRKNIFL